MMLQYFTGISALPSLCFHSPVWGVLSGWTTFPPAHCNYISWQFSVVHHGSSQLKCIKSIVSKWGVQTREDTDTWEERTAMHWSRIEDQCIPTCEYKVCPFFLSATPDWEVTPLPLPLLHQESCSQGEGLFPQRVNAERGLHFPLVLPWMEKSVSKLAGQEDAETPAVLETAGRSM